MFKSIASIHAKSFPSSWKNNGEAVTGLDLVFLPMTENLYGVDADLIVSFLKRNDSVLSNNLEEWEETIGNLQTIEKQVYCHYDEQKILV